MAGGHVFVVHSDLTRLACDAWLLPCDSEQDIAGSWRRHAPENIKRARDKDRYRRLDPGHGRGEDQQGPPLRRLDRRGTGAAALVGRHGRPA